MYCILHFFLYNPFTLRIILLFLDEETQVLIFKSVHLLNLRSLFPFSKLICLYHASQHLLKNIYAR